MKEVEVDERGFPTEMNESGSASAHAPSTPCEVCHHGTLGFEWCQSVDTCAATVDWERVYGR